MTDRETSEATRRAFLFTTGAAAASTVLPGRAGAGQEQQQTPPAGTQQQDEPGKEPTSSAITGRTIAEAEKLTGVAYTKAERRQMIGTIEEQVERFRRRLAEPVPLNGSAPASIFDPRLPHMIFKEEDVEPILAADDPGPLPADETDIAFAPVAHQARWLRTGELTSRRLTEVYLERLERIGPKLECVVTLTEDLALEQARRADEELATGHDRGPLHGIPWGVKDIFDTAGIPTTWGANPYRDRVPETDAVLVQRLEEAGAVLMAKLTTGALAYGDRWYAGQTKNPFNTEQGSSGSSAGPAAAAVAGLVGFSIGSETLGSIVSPSMRCGATGLRPTFGRIPRGGCMALSWSMDKVGPIARTVEDCMRVLLAVHGADESDPSSLDMPLNFDARLPVAGLRVGYDPAWFQGMRVSDLDRHVLDALGGLAVRLVQVELPRWPYEVLRNILYVDAAAAMEELTLDNRDDELVWQDPEAWPNSFRQARFIPAIEYVQADRFRRQVMEMMDELYQDVDVLISPSYAGSLLLITNHTGHPSLTIRSGFRDDGRPHGITLWGSLFDEGTLCNVGMALERELGAWDTRPKIE